MSAELVKQEIVWIDSGEALERYCDEWSKCALLALDTEFMRSSTYYPKAGLIQINDGIANYLVDPLKISDWYPLVEILDDENILVALHSCSEDLEVLQIELGTIPSRIFDTQIAAGFLGNEASLGYAATVKLALGIDLPKTETRSDWLQRPLSKPQATYAAMDVEYLHQLASNFIKQLESMDRLDWVMEEGGRIYKNYKKLQNTQDSYLRIKSAWKLPPRKLALLQSLCRWRENAAQQKDLPRNRVLKEKTLFEIALRCPDHVSKLRAIEGISDRVIRKDGSVLVDLVRQSQQMTEDQLPSALPRPFAKEDREKLSVLREKAKEEAERLKISPEILLRKKEGEALLRFGLQSQWREVEGFFSGWRKVEIAQPLIKTLKEL